MKLLLDLKILTKNVKRKEVDITGCSIWDWREWENEIEMERRHTHTHTQHWHRQIVDGVNMVWESAKMLAGFGLVYKYRTRVLCLVFWSLYIVDWFLLTGYWLTARLLVCLLVYVSVCVCVCVYECIWIDYSQNCFLSMGFRFWFAGLLVAFFISDHEKRYSYIDG